MLKTSFLPNNLTVFLTKNCNLDCSYCFVNKNKGIKSSGLKLSFIKKAISYFLKLPGVKKNITFTGGEPLLNYKSLKEACFYARNNISPSTRLNINIETNGTLLTRSFLSFVKENKVYLEIGIDGDKKNHDFNRPFKNERKLSTYNQVIKKLSKIIKHGLEPKANLVFSPLNYKFLLSNIQHLQNLGFESINFYPSLYALWREKELRELKIIFKRFTEFYILTFKKERKVFKNSLLDNFVKKIDLYKPLICQRIHLDCDGYFYPCDKIMSLSKSKRKEFIIGNIKKGIDNQLQLRLVEEQRKKIRDLVKKDCRSCRYVKYCFCSIGHYIYFSSQGLDFKQYFPQFCKISQIYIKSFLEIKRQLNSNPLFRRIYSI